MTSSDIKKIEIPDVDLDVNDRPRAATLFPDAVVASQVQKHKLVPHNSGLYFQKVPVDPSSGLSSFPYEQAEQVGYFKVDLLPNHVYDLVESNEELEELLAAPVTWKWFTDKRFYNNVNTKYRLTHLSKYHRLACQYPPKSVEDVAVLIALIRPRKKYLKGKPWEEIKELVWQEIDGEDGYFFKKSHAVAFALLVILHAQIIARKLNLVKSKRDTGFFF